MAIMRMEGLDTLMIDLKKVEKLPVDEMLNAGADVAVQAIRDKAETMLQGPYNKGAVKSGVRKYKPVKSADGAYIKIGFEGEQHGTRVAEIAFINEFGKTNQPARPFVDTAKEASAGDVAVAERRAFDEHLKKHNL